MNHWLSISKWLIHYKALIDINTQFINAAINALFLIYKHIYNFLSF